MSHRIALLVFGVAAVSGISLGQEPVLKVETVRAAWKERESKVKTARFEWKQTVFIAKGAYDGAKALIMAENGGKDPGPNPPEDHSYTSDCSLSIDGDRFVHQFTRRSWDTKQKKYSDTLTEYKFDGNKQLSLDHPGFVDWPVAYIRARPRGAQLSLDAGPVLRNLRGVNEKLRAEDLDEYSSSGAVLAIGNVRGRELISKGTPTNSERHLWIDPARGCVLLRYNTGPANRPIRQIDVKYKADGTVGWVPAEWKIVEASNKDGRVTATTSATVTSYSINEPFDEATFAFTLPLGCRVVDETRSPHDYIIREDGTSRVMSPSDFGKTYQEIVNTPGPTSAAGWRWWAGPLLAVFFGLGVLLFGTRIWLIRKSRRQTSTDSGYSARADGSDEAA